MPSTQKLSTYRTTWATLPNDGVTVTYVSTEIVRAEGDIITLNSGGWQTVTTKRKMNQAANQFGLRFGVHQVKGEWFVDIKCSPSERARREQEGHRDFYWQGLEIPFRDGMKFDKWTGEVLA